MSIVGAQQTRADIALKAELQQVVDHYHVGAAGGADDGVLVILKRIIFVGDGVDAEERQEDAVDKLPVPEDTSTMEG